MFTVAWSPITRMAHRLRSARFHNALNAEHVPRPLSASDRSLENKYAEWICKPESVNVFLCSRTGWSVSVSLFLLCIDFTKHFLQWSYIEAIIRANKTITLRQLMLTPVSSQTWSKNKAKRTQPNRQIHTVLVTNAINEIDRYMVIFNLLMQHKTTLLTHIGSLLQ